MLKGYVLKKNGKWLINVTYKGYGSMSLYDIFVMENILEKLKVIPEDHIYNMCKD